MEAKDNQAADQRNDIDRYIEDLVEQYANWYDRNCGPMKKRYLYI